MQEYFRSGARALARVMLTFALLPISHAQIIEFESGGVRYKALTHNGMTLMFSPMTLRIREYAILQLAVSNGSPLSWTVAPEDCVFQRADGTTVRAQPAKTLINELIAHGSRGDVIKLVAAYEASLYSNAQIHSTNGYEARRQNAFADIGSNKIKAAAAASAIAFPTSNLKPGQSTDGAVFFPNQGRPLGTGRLIVHAAGEDYVFPVDAEPHLAPRDLHETEH